MHPKLENIHVAFSFIASGWLKKYFLMVLLYEFILDTFQDHRIECLGIDGQLNRCPIEQ